MMVEQRTKQVAGTPCGQARPQDGGVRTYRPEQGKHRDVGYREPDWTVSHELAIALILRLIRT